MHISHFDFHVPEHLIAQTPLAQRETSRLLVRPRHGALEHTEVTALPTMLRPGTLLIFNDSRVFPSRLLGRTASGRRVEVFLLEEAEDGVWRALARPLKALRPGNQLHFDQLEAEVLQREPAPDGAVPTLLVRFPLSRTKLLDWLQEHAYIPLPPYIARPNPKVSAQSEDRERYQTVYARNLGSVAAPTAGLHFSDALLQALSERQVQTATVCLHVGAGTFLPVKTEEVNEHPMHYESALVPKATLAAIKLAKDQGRDVIAVGTTTLRTLESFWRSAGGSWEQLPALGDTWQRTNLFIRPQHERDVQKVGLVNGLFTNFHQPKSTLFMLVAALIGIDAAQAMYAEAIQREYRLFSYGDANMLWL